MEYTSATNTMGWNALWMGDTAEADRAFHAMKNATIVVEKKPAEKAG